MSSEAEDTAAPTEEKKAGSGLIERVPMKEDVKEKKEKKQKKNKKE